MEQRVSEAGTQRGGSARMKGRVLGRHVCTDLAVRQLGVGCCGWRDQHRLFNAKDVAGKPPASGRECWTCVSHLGQDWLSKHETGTTPTHSNEQGKPLGKASKNG